MFGSRFAGRRWLDKDAPVVLAETFEERLPGLRVLQRRKPGFQFQFSPSVQRVESANVAPAKLLTENSVVNQKWPGRFGTGRACQLAVDPAPTVQRRAAAGNQSVYVRMMVQPLVPGVQHHQRSGLHPSFRLDTLPQRLRRSLHQGPIQDRPIAQDQWRKFVGKREDNLEISHTGNQQVGRLVQPW